MTGEPFDGNETVAADPDAGSYSCDSCGGKLVFSPGTDSLACPWCGAENRITQDTQSASVVEWDYEAALAGAQSMAAEDHVNAVDCPGCGAQTTLDSHVHTDHCSFCGIPLVNVQAVDHARVPPQYLLPFKLKESEASRCFLAWIRKLWFAPSALKKMTGEIKLSGIYLPYCTFDSAVRTEYRGERGTAYYVTVSYTVRVNGRSERRTRQERRIRWSSVSGVVNDLFDDILVASTNSLDPKYLDRLEPWDLGNLVPYTTAYAQGFRTELGRVPLRDCFTRAQKKMETEIRGSIRRDIGGDEQRISYMAPHYDKITYKSILLPLWLSAFRFNEKSYHFLVNARTGEVYGERPWSVTKIVLAAGAVAGVVAFVYMFMQFQ